MANAPPFATHDSDVCCFGNPRRVRLRETWYQTVGAAIILGSAFPAYRQILLEPGQELNLSWATHLWATVGAVMIQCAYWFRLMRVPLAVRKPNIVASQVVLFLARLSFIFGSALFGLVFFRHLPELEIVPG